MPADFDDTYLAATGMSTRAVQTSSGELVVFTREAIEDVAEQVRHGFIPIVVEHLLLLPPVGRWHAAEIVTAEDGEQELFLHGRPFRTIHPVGADPDPWALLPNGAPVAETRPAITSVRLEPRNFEPSALAEAKATAPIAIYDEHRWSELPPLEWILVIPVVWGATKFLASFLDELGGAAARGVTDWIAGLGSSAKDSERDQIITLQFDLPGREPIGPIIYAFVPIAAVDNATAVALPAIAAATQIAELAGIQADAHVMGNLQRAAFIWQDDDWHLAWWILDDEAVRVTNWFLANEPDPARFLGRPLLE